MNGYIIFCIMGIFITWIVLLINHINKTEKQSKQDFGSLHKDLLLGYKIFNIEKGILRPITTMGQTAIKINLDKEYFERGVYYRTSKKLGFFTVFDTFASARRYVREHLSSEDEHLVILACQYDPAPEWERNVGYFDGKQMINNYNLRHISVPREIDGFHAHFICPDFPVGTVLAQGFVIL